MEDDKRHEADENEAEVSDEQQEAALRRLRDKQGVTDSAAPADDDIIIK
jgi:hypothetical protein